MFKSTVFSGLILVSLLGAQVVVDQPSEEPIRVDVNVVNVPVTVSDPQGKFVVDLLKSDFEVFEDGQPVEIRYFTKIIDEDPDTPPPPPLHVGFLIDLSNTARVYYKSYQNSIGDLAYILVPEGGNHKGFLMGYHTEVDLLVKMTTDPYPISQRMEKLKHGGGSAMLDAAYRACTEQLASKTYQGACEPRKALVIVGDGHDNASKETVESVIAAAQREQVTIYAVSTVAWGFHEAEEKNLRHLAKATGGRVVRPMEDIHSDVQGFLSNPQDAGNYAREVGTGEYARAQLQALYGAILDVSGAVQSQYILGYVPPKPFSDESFRQIRVKVNLDAEVEINHRQGYYPPKK